MARATADGPPFPSIASAIAAPSGASAGRLAANTPPESPRPSPCRGRSRAGPCCQLPQRPPREPAVVRASSASARKAQGQRLRRTKADPAGAARAGIVPAGAKRGPAGWGGADGRGLGAWAPAAVFYRQARAAFPEMWQWRFPPGRGGALG